MRPDDEVRIMVDLLKLLYTDEEVRIIAEDELNGEMDKNSEINIAKREAFKQGKERASEKIAIKLLKRGMTVKEVIQVTSVDKGVLERLMIKNNIPPCRI